MSEGNPRKRISRKSHNSSLGQCLVPENYLLGGKADMLRQGSGTRSSEPCSEPSGSLQPRNIVQSGSVKYLVKTNIHAAHKRQKPQKCDQKNRARENGAYRSPPFRRDAFNQHAACEEDKAESRCRVHRHEPRQQTLQDWSPKFPSRKNNQGCQGYKNRGSY